MSVEEKGIEVPCRQVRNAEWQPDGMQNDLNEIFYRHFAPMVYASILK